MKYLQQFVTTSLNVGGSIDASQTTGIVLQSLNNVDATKPSVACISWADPLSTSVAEWVTYTSINSTTNELNGVTRGAEGYSAKTHSNGATVAFPLSKAHVNELNDAYLTEHTAAGLHNSTQISEGWTPITETFTYASATTITVATGATNRFQKGDKLKVTNVTVKYFYVVAVASTLLTVTGGSDYTLESAAITSPYLSRIENPFGFPSEFAYTPSWTNVTLGAATNVGYFSIRQRQVFYRLSLTMAADTSVTGSIQMTIPVTTGYTTDSNNHHCSYADSGSAGNVPAFVEYVNGTTMVMRAMKVDGTYMSFAATSATVPITWTTNDVIRVAGIYQMA